MEKKRPQLSLDELQQLRWLLGGGLALIAVGSVGYLDVQAGALAALTAAGYQPGELPAAGPPHHDKPSWADGPRVTTTDVGDAAMSGDYRQY